LSLTPESGHLVEVSGLGDQRRQRRENMDDLARMSEVTNEQRAQWARAAHDAFARQNGQSVDLPDGDTEVFIGHWCVARACRYLSRWTVSSITWLRVRAVR